MAPRLQHLVLRAESDKGTYRREPAPHIWPTEQARSPRLDVGAQQGKCFRCIGRRAAGWRRGAWWICTGKPACVLGYHVGDAYAQVGRGRIAVIYTPVWYCYRSSEIADTSGQIEVAQLGDI